MRYEMQCDCILQKLCRLCTHKAAGSRGIQILGKTHTGMGKVRLCCRVQVYITARHKHSENEDAMKECGTPWQPGHCLIGHSSLRSCPSASGTALQRLQHPSHLHTAANCVSVLMWSHSHSCTALPTSQTPLTSLSWCLYQWYPAGTCHMERRKSYALCRHICSVFDSKCMLVKQQI